MMRWIGVVLIGLMPMHAVAAEVADPQVIAYMQRLGKMFDGKLPLTRNNVTIVSREFVEPNIIATTYRLESTERNKDPANNGAMDVFIAMDIQSTCAPPAPWVAVRGGAEFRARYEAGGRVETRVLNRDTCFAEVQKSQTVLESCRGNAQCEAEKSRAKVSGVAGTLNHKDFAPLQPRYPAQEFLDGITGRCTVVAEVDSRGRARDVRIGKSTGNRNLDKSCLFAGLYSQYPIQVTGDKTIHMSVEYDFTVDEKSRQEALKAKAAMDAARKSNP